MVCQLKHCSSDFHSIPMRMMPGKILQCLILMLAYCVFLPALAWSQDTTVRDMEEVIIYSNKFAENRKNLVQKIDVVSARRIAQSNAQNTGDLLSQTGNVFVQKSQQGGSSPVIRGFEASRVLLVIDGIRMNNAIYRAGHLQNAITVDQNMLENIEVLYGPASTIYGSDALGGVVHFRTKSPRLSPHQRLLTTGSAFVRYSSANHEKTVHTDLSIGGRRFAWLQSYNYSDFGDLKMGRNYPDRYLNFGSRPFYITMINGVDSIVMNADSNVQKFSGYRQWDLTQKFLYRPNARFSHALNLQYSNTGHVPRYDRLQDVRSGALRYAEWYYGPQLRELAAYEFNYTPLTSQTEFKAIISYQHIRESRHQREYRKYDRLDNRLEDLKVWAFTIDGRKKWQQHELTAGIDGQLNQVRSEAFRKNILTGATSKLDSRYPDGGNRMNYFGFYVQHLLKFGNGKWVLNDGLRIQFTDLESSISDNSFFQFPFSEFSQRNRAITGNLGLVFRPDEKTRIATGLSTGFRAPNIDDMARIFESNSASRQLIIPDPQTGPEYTYNMDFTLAQSTSQWRWEAVFFYTLFRDAIALAPSQLNGQDSLLYNGVMSRVYANRNVNRARVLGFSAQASWDFLPGWNIFSTISYTRGRLRPLNAATIPLDHIPPVYGKTSLSYNRHRIQTELYALYNGWKKIKDYNPSGEDNAQYATADGTPAWVTMNIKSGWQVHRQLLLQLGIENILDRNYRHFASGFSAAGRNFILAVRASF